MAESLAKNREVLGRPPGRLTVARAFNHDHPLAFWCTDWMDTSQNYPHEIVVDLGQVQNVSGFYYLSIPDKAWLGDGDVKDYELYLSQNPGTFQNPSSTGTFTPSKITQVVHFTPQKARYLKYRALSTIKGSRYVNVAELGILRE